jgi:hypothetical protein
MSLGQAERTMIATEPAQENERLTRFTHLFEVKRAAIDNDAGHDNPNVNSQSDGGPIQSRAGAQPPAVYLQGEYQEDPSCVDATITPRQLEAL